jgi:DNA replication and repair protein RecF
LRLKNLKIRNLRNISEADLDFSPNINFLWGENGAGKTTVLESLYLLARSRSFNKGKQHNLIKRDQQQLTIFLSGKKANGEPVRIGLIKDRKNTIIRMNGEKIKRLSELARSFPLALITPHTHKIFEEGPEYRRRLMNWGMFHVEHQFGLCMSQYNRVLNQRNQALKENTKNISIWDNQLIEFAAQIKNTQDNYLHGWSKYLEEVTKLAKDLPELSVHQYKGWDEGISLSEALKQKYQLDKRRGYTSVGPHRADLMFELDGKPIKHYLSRGQQKRLIILIIIAHSVYMEKLSGELPVLLLDDLQSELDHRSQEEILHIIKNYNFQTVISGIENPKYLSEKVTQEAYMFHVEQGKISPLNT